MSLQRLLNVHYYTIRSTSFCNRMHQFRELDSLMMLYESDACFASQPGQFIRGSEGIRQSIQRFVDMKGKLEFQVKRVLMAADLGSCN